jgi:hypothetical protein
MTTRIQQWLGLQQLDDLNELPLVQDLLYRGTIDMLARTRCVARCVHLHTQAGVGTYTLDHSILSLVDIEDGAVRRTRRDQVGWDGNGYIGTVVYPPNSIVVCSFTFTMIRADILRLNPAPAQDGEVDVWAVLRPSKMDEDTDSPGDEAYGAIPEEFQDAIVLYATWHAADYGDDSSSQMGERYRVLYEGQDGNGGRLREIRKLVNKRGTARAPARRVRLASLADRRRAVG